MKINEITQHPNAPVEPTQHHQHPQHHQAQPQHHVAPKQQHFDWEGEIENPHYTGEEGSDETDTIPVGVNYEDESEPYVPARVRYDDYDHPEEGGIDFEVTKVVNLVTGEDITKIIDNWDELNGLIHDHIEREAANYDPGYDESVNNESALLESIKKLSGLR